MRFEMLGATTFAKGLDVTSRTVSLDTPAKNEEADRLYKDGYSLATRGTWFGDKSTKALTSSERSSVVAAADRLRVLGDAQSADMIMSALRNKEESKSTSGTNYLAAASSAGALHHCGASGSIESFLLFFFCLLIIFLIFKMMKISRSEDVTL